MFNKGSKVKVISGKHAGKTGYFDKKNTRRPGMCFIMFDGPNRNGAQVGITNLVGIHMTDDEIREKWGV